MQRARSIEEFLVAPGGACVADRTWLFVNPHEDFSGYFVWGRPGASDFDSLARVLPLMHAPGRKPHRAIVDLSAVEGLDLGSFDRALAYNAAHFEEFGRTITKLALVRSGGAMGAIAAGFFAVAPSYCPVKVFTSARDALVWLEREADIPLLDEIALHVSEARGDSDVVRNLRALLASTSRELSMKEAATKLAISPRTLQRKLGEANTTFTDEMILGRVRTAERLLAETQSPVTEIALTVGYASLQHFGQVFRKINGTSPTEWREQRRQTVALSYRQIC